jgi:hypothetical protein
MCSRLTLLDDDSCHAQHLATVNFQCFIVKDGFRHRPKTQKISPNSCGRDGGAWRRVMSSRSRVSCIFPRRPRGLAAMWRGGAGARRCSIECKRGGADVSAVVVAVGGGGSACVLDWGDVRRGGVPGPGGGVCHSPAPCPDPDVHRFAGGLTPGGTVSGRQSALLLMHWVDYAQGSLSPRNDNITV